MSERKQQLLKQYRKQKRVALSISLALILLLALTVTLWLLPVGILLLWIVHEAWFSDHLFYDAKGDYRYQFPDSAIRAKARLVGRNLQLEPDVLAQLNSTSSVFLKVKVASSLSGRWFDPYIKTGNNQQTFERGAQGVRYLNLSGQVAALKAGDFALSSRFCSVSVEEVIAFNQVDYAKKRLLILAPHADDAELAAFGLYSQASDVAIVTVTQGEIEAENYQALGLTLEKASSLKGRLRTWDSLAIPLWGGVPQSQCVQLGYYCLRLREMQAQPDTAFGSRQSGENDIRSVRQMNPIELPADTDGEPTWNNLVQDLVAVLEHFQPEVILTPHPELDPHSDHVATTEALMQSMALVNVPVETLLLYANHLHDNDRWPMGSAGQGVALPPAVTPLPADELWSYELSVAVQLDKAMALAMQHDLQDALPLKRKLRRCLQYWLLGRSWPKTGTNEFFRKAVRKHELFWVRTLAEQKR